MRDRANALLEDIKPEIPPKPPAEAIEPALEKLRAKRDELNRVLLDVKNEEENSDRHQSPINLDTIKISTSVDVAEIKFNSNNLTSPLNPCKAFFQNHKGKITLGAFIGGAITAMIIMIRKEALPPNNNRFPYSYFYSPASANFASQTLGFDNRNNLQNTVINKIEFSLNAHVRSITTGWLPSDIDFTSILTNGTHYLTSITTNKAPIVMAALSQNNFTFDVDKILGSMGIVMNPNMVRVMVGDKWEVLRIQYASSRGNPTLGFISAGLISQSEKYFSGNDIFPASNLNRIGYGPANVNKYGVISFANTIDAGWKIPNIRMLKMRFSFLTSMLTIDGFSSGFQALQSNQTAGVTFARNLENILQEINFDSVLIDAPFNSTNVQNYTEFLQTVKSNLPGIEVGVTTPGSINKINSLSRTAWCQLMQAADKIYPWVINLNNPSPGSNTDFPQPLFAHPQSLSSESVFGSLLALNNTGCIKSKQINIPITTECQVYKVNQVSNYGINIPWTQKKANVDYRCFYSKNCKAEISLPSDLQCYLYNTFSQTVCVSSSANLVVLCEDATNYQSYTSSVASKVQTAMEIFKLGFGGFTNANIFGDLDVTWDRRTLTYAGYRALALIRHSPVSSLVRDNPLTIADVTPERSSLLQGDQIKIENVTTESKFMGDLSQNIRIGFYSGLFTHAVQQCTLNYFAKNAPQADPEHVFKMIHYTKGLTILVITGSPIAASMMIITNRLFPNQNFLSLMLAMISLDPRIFFMSSIAGKVGNEIAELDVITSGCELIGKSKALEYCVNYLPFHCFITKSSLASAYVFQSYPMQYCHQRILAAKDYLANQPNVQFAATKFESAYQQISTRIEFMVDVLDTAIGVPMEITNMLLNAGSECVMTLAVSTKEHISQKLSTVTGILKQGFFACRRKQNADAVLIDHRDEVLLNAAARSS